MRDDPGGTGAPVVHQLPLRAVDLLALPLFSVLALALFGGSWVDPSKALVGVPADNVLTVWSLAWAAHALAGGHSLFHSYLVGAPAGVNLLSTTAVTLAGIVLSPVTWLLGPVVAYDALASGALALSGWCAYLCLRRYARGRVGPLAGALVYGFSPALVAQSYGHVQITTAFLVPLVVILVDEAVVRRRCPEIAVGAGLGLVLVAQFLLSSEVLATEVMMGLVLVAVLAATYPRDVSARLPGALVVGGAALFVFAVLAGWPVYLEVAGTGHTVGGAVRGVGKYVDDLANLVLPTGVQALGPAGLARHFKAGLVESNGYLGIPLLVALGWAVWRCRRIAAVRVAAVVGLVALIFSLGPQLEVGGHVTGFPLPWALLGRLPVLRDVLPSRLAVYTDLAAAAILAIWVGEVDGAARARAHGSRRPLGSGRPLGSRRPPAGVLRYEAAGALVVLVLIGVTLFPALPFPSYKPPVPAFFASARSSAAIPTGTVAVVLPLGTSSSLLWQALAGMRFSMPENQFGTGPRPPSPLGQFATALLAAQATGALPGGSAIPGLRTGLARSCATSVAAGPMPHEAAVVSLVSQVVGHGARSVGGVYLWHLPYGCARG